MITMGIIIVLLLLANVYADDIRFEFEQFKSQQEAEYRAKFSELESKMATYESKMATYESKMAGLECMKKKFCERDGFTYGDGICYYISTEKKTWDESRQWCRDRQADLVIIKSKETQDLVASFNKYVWLGLTDRVTEGVFHWVDGTPLTTPMYWMPGQPQAEYKNPNAECDCVVQYDGSLSGLPTTGWVDTKCSNTLYWMCERSLC